MRLVVRRRAGSYFQPIRRAAVVAGFIVSRFRVAGLLQAGDKFEFVQSFADSYQPWRCIHRGVRANSARAEFFLDEHRVAYVEVRKRRKRQNNHRGTTTYEIRMPLLERFHAPGGSSHARRCFRANYLD